MSYDEVQLDRIEQRLEQIHRRLWWIALWILVVALPIIGTLIVIGLGGLGALAGVLALLG
jgi:cytochrome b561